MYTYIGLINRLFTYRRATNGPVQGWCLGIEIHVPPAVRRPVYLRTQKKSFASVCFLGQKRQAVRFIFNAIGHRVRREPADIVGLSVKVKGDLLLFPLRQL